MNDKTSDRKLDRLWTEVYRNYAEGTVGPVDDPLARKHPVLRLRSWRSRLHVGRCYRCRHTWRVVCPHTTMYLASRGCFPLCEGCWQALTPEERLPFYDKMFGDWPHNWGTDNGLPWNEVWQAVHDAVMAGG